MYVPFFPLCSIDAVMFPPFARRMDISHLQKHHHSLESLIEKLLSDAQSLSELHSFDSWNQNETITSVEELQTAVNEHEKQEEEVVSTENLQKLFTPQEMKEQFPFI